MSLSKLIVGTCLTVLLSAPVFAQEPNIPEFDLKDAFRKETELPSLLEKDRYVKKEFYYFDRNKDNKCDLIFVKYFMRETLNRDGTTVPSYETHALGIDEDFDGVFFDWILFDEHSKNGELGADGIYDYVYKWPLKNRYPPKGIKK